jgi:hypothetical protein
MTKDERNPNAQMTKLPAGALFVIRILSFLRHSIFVIRHCFVTEAFMVRAARLATRRLLATYNESDRANDSDVPARIL